MFKSYYKYLSFFFLTILTMLPGKSYSQYDSIAVAILDSMSNEISELETCSFKYSSEFDISNSIYGLITHTEAGTVVLKGPDKMFVEKKGDKGHKQFFYNGKNYILYSFDKNQYASAPASVSLIEFIDSLSRHFGVEFPGIDVFYPDFVDNILETSDNLIYLGLGYIHDQNCYHIAGVRDDMTFQYWINDESYLPVKLSIVYKDKEGNPGYSIEYSDWKLNESIDDSKFEFTVPEGAQLIKLIR